MPKLSEATVQDALAKLPEWSVVDEKLHREYRFPDFSLAFGFMAACAVMIEKRNHHPEWFNAYNRVIVDLTTHDAGGITDKDLELAGAMEAIAGKLL